VNVVYNCHIPETMGYPERGYCFHHAENGFLMWKCYFDDLMRAMWRVYGWEFHPDEPDHPHLLQVPLLRDWNEGGISADGPTPIEAVAATAHAFRDALAELRRSGPELAESVEHGEALAAFLEQANATAQSVSIEEFWGSGPNASPAD
jgi:hypothetical protein